VQQASDALQPFKGISEGFVAGHEAINEEAGELGAVGVALDDQVDQVRCGAVVALSSKVGVDQGAEVRSSESGLLLEGVKGLGFALRSELPRCAVASRLGMRGCHLQ
jgi:hypothetical protein